MRTKRAFMASLVVTFVLLSALANRGARQRIMTGTIGGFEAGEWIAVANDNRPNGFPIALREATVYEGNLATFKRGADVTVWYRSVGERFPSPTRCACCPTRRSASFCASAAHPHGDATRLFVFVDRDPPVLLQ